MSRPAFVVLIVVASTTIGIAFSGDAESTYGVSRWVLLVIGAAVILFVAAGAAVAKALRRP